jgi:chlorophyllase-like protein
LTEIESAASAIVVRVVAMARMGSRPEIGAALVVTALVVAWSCGKSPGGHGADAAIDLDGSSATDGAGGLDANHDLIPDAGTSTTVRYDHDGPEGYSTMAMSVDTGSGTITVNVYLPNSSGPHAVVSVSPGFQQPATGYVSYGRRLASYGIIALIADDQGILARTPSVVARLVYVIGTWIPAENASMASALFGKVDLQRIGLAGHSRGGQASLIAAEHDLQGKVRAWFGLDPVDLAQNGALARTDLGAIGIPTTFVGATIASSCSPTADNYEVLYDQAPHPAARIRAIGAGHTQFEDQSGCVLCDLCTPSGTAPESVVLSEAVRYLTAFFARELLADGAVGPAFEGAGGPADIAAGRVMIDTK